MTKKLSSFGEYVIARGKRPARAVPVSNQITRRGQASRLVTLLLPPPVTYFEPMFETCVQEKA